MEQTIIDNKSQLSNEQYKIMLLESEQQLGTKYINSPRISESDVENRD